MYGVDSAEDILKAAKEERVRFLRLQFTDILGSIKNVEIPESQFARALDGQVVFDGSSIEGFFRLEESDMVLWPDPATFRIFPWEDKRGRVARMICDVRLLDGSPFPGCPRTVLKNVAKQAEDAGYTLVVGSEVEFFLFLRSAEGKATRVTHDVGGYFDLAPIDRGEEARRDMVSALERMGFRVSGAHHEVAPGQHEIDFKPVGVIEAADTIVTCRFMVRKIAMDNELHATFMPKPFFRQNGSGLHLYQALFKDDKNAFSDASARYRISKPGLQYIAGVLEHAKGLALITNPLVNSYKRLSPNFEAPTHVAWSEVNRNPLIRVSHQKAEGTFCEFRLPDPACNPYLCLAAVLASGLDGIRRELDPGPPVNKDIFKMSQRERSRLGIENLPGDLSEAIRFFQKNRFLQAALGPTISEHMIQAKRSEWQEYIGQVHPWELDRYLASY